MNNNNNNNINIIFERVFFMGVIMKGRIYLSKNEYLEYDYSVEFDVDYGYCISINTDLHESFYDLIMNSYDLGNSILQELFLIENYDFDFTEEDINLLKEINNRKEEYLLNAEYVEFYFDIDEIMNYIKINPILKTKKIILNESIGLNKEILDKISLELDGNVDNLYFKLHENTKLISFSDCVSTYEILDGMVEEIKKYDFSPLENIMYVYDLVRNRVYLAGNSDDDASIPRDLSSVLLGNNIVCLGYARIFNSLLEKLGIRTREVLLFDDSQKSGHARNEIYIKDEKYGVDGVYYFDPTWDSKKNDNDNSYLSSYKYFAKTKSYMDEVDCGLIIDKKFPYFSSFIGVEFNDIFNKYGLKKISKEMIKSINHMSSLINGKYLIDKFYTYEDSPFYGKINIDQITEDLVDLSEYFDRPIYANVLLEVLYNVRKIQYYNEPDKFPFSFNEFYKIMRLSNWGFDGETSYERMLVSIFKKQIVSREAYEKYSEKNNLSKNIEGVKLTKTLR